MTSTNTTLKKPASIRLSARLNNALNEQAKQLKMSKDRLVRKALENMLEEIQDVEDAKHILEMNESSVSLPVLKKRLGL